MVRIVTDQTQIGESELLLLSPVFLRIASPPFRRNALHKNFTFPPYYRHIEVLGLIWIQKSLLKGG